MSGADRALRALNLARDAAGMPPVDRDLAEHTGQHGRHCMACAAYLRRCGECGAWFLSTAQRDRHAAKQHGDTEQ